MAEMVFGKQQFRFPIEFWGMTLQLLAQQIFKKKLLAQPNRHGLAKRGETLWGESKVGFQQPLEL